MTLLPWVEINNFRGISHLRYEPKQVNLLIGRNNSGKSTILEAIYAVLTGRDCQTLIGNGRSLNRYGINIHSEYAKIVSEDHTFSLFCDTEYLPVDSLDKAVEEICATMFSGGMKFNLTASQKKQIVEYVIKEGLVSFGVHDNTVCRIEVTPNGREPILKIVSDLQKIFSDEEISSEELFEFASRFNSMSYGISTGLGITRENIRVFGDYEKLLSRVTTDPLELIELDKFVQEQNLIPNVERLMEGGVVYRDGDETYFLPYAVHGRGFGILLNMISVIRQCRDGVLLIEEPENHMHPGYLQVFVENLMMLAKKLNVQVFMTTHSYDLIEALSRYPMDAEEEDSILISNVVSRDGEHELYNYSPSDAQKTMNQLMIDLRGT